jgi:uncharacterized protein (TIGR04255 family)
MTEALHFEKAPIREAVIAIQVHDLPEPTSLELRSLPEQVKDSYPQKLELSEAQFVGQVGPQGPKATASQRIIGFQFQAADSKQMFQARVNGFSFHRLAPYQSWKPFRDEAFRLWKLYREVVGPVKVVNFLVRYINALVVPGQGRLEDHLRVYPEIPSDIPQTLNNYFMRLNFPLEDEGSGEGTLTMTQTLLPSESEPGTSSILLDNLFAYGASDVSDDILWKRIDAVQAVKNRVFVAALTPEMQKRIS